MKGMKEAQMHLNEHVATINCVKWAIRVTATKGIITNKESRLMEHIIGH